MRKFHPDLLIRVLLVVVAAVLIILAAGSKFPLP
jgi:hypothetical protein